MKDKEAKRIATEKAQIEVLIEKHRPHTPKTPDEVNTSGTGKNANTDGREGTEKVKPPHEKATKDSQIKTSQKKGDKANKGNPDTLLGDPVVNIKTCIEKAKEKGQKDKVGINDIGIFEFIFHGLSNPPDLEGIDEDRLRELQNAIQEQLCQRDKERERNITKRVQEFEKTFDFDFVVQKVPDDEDIDIAKIVKDDKPKYDRKSATEIERQLREKEAKRLALEKTKRI